MAYRGILRNVSFIVALALSGGLLFSTAPSAQSLSAQETTLSLRRALERLPYYGVFDFLAFSVDRGTVTLAGYAYGGTLKSAAEKAAKRVSGVDEVANQLELLPASLNDDRIRVGTFYRIYTDSGLSRYGSGGPSAARYDALQFLRFPGQQPFGNYAIHIVVKGGRTTLLGAVGSAFDKQIAEVRAREVEGVFEVKNELEISKN